MVTVAVKPIDDSPEALALANAMVESLGDHDIPASVGDGLPGSAHVLAEQSETKGKILVVWTWVPADGAEPTHSRAVIPKPVWEQRSAWAMKTYVDPAAAALIGLPAASEPKGARNRPKASIQPLSGLPGDGDHALTRALRAALERQGVVMTAKNPDYTILGKVEITPGRPGEDMLAVVWTIKRADGRQLGTVEQKGPVAKGVLAGPWGSLARDVGEGGASGVVQAIDADRSQSLQKQ